MARLQADSRLIILDRDGVINRDSEDYVKTTAEWIPLPGSIEAIARLSKAGYTVTVATNQSGIGRGLFERPALTGMHRKLRRLVGKAGGRVDRIVVCPHAPGDGCDCRKPKTGLLRRLASFYGASLQGVPFVGDSLRDIQAAFSVGARPVLVRTGNGRQTESVLTGSLRAIDVYDDLAAAADGLIGRE